MLEYEYFLPPRRHRSLPVSAASPTHLVPHAALLATRLLHRCHVLPLLRQIPQSPARKEACPTPLHNFHTYTLPAAAAAAAAAAATHRDRVTELLSPTFFQGTTSISDVRKGEERSSIFSGSKRASLTHVKGPFF